MRVLVTGGAGFVGSHLVDALVSQGHEVLVVDWLVPQVHPSGEWPEWRNTGAEYARFPLSNNIALRQRLGGAPLGTPANPKLRVKKFEPEVIYHLAAQVGVGQAQYDLRRYVDDNCSDTATLLEEMLKMGVRPKKVIVASSMSVYGEGTYRCTKQDEFDSTVCGVTRGPGKCEYCNVERVPTGVCDVDDAPRPTSVYAITKYFQEMLVLNVCESYQIPAVALRYFNIHGPRQQLSNPYTGVCAIFLARLKNGQAPIVYEDGLQSRDFISVKDITRANVLAMESDATGVFNVCTGQPTTVLGVVDALRTAIHNDNARWAEEQRAKGKRVRPRPNTPAPQITHTKRAGDIRHCFGCPERAAAVLGFKAEVSFQDGMAELWDWAKDQDAEDNVQVAHDTLVAQGLIG